MSSMISVVMPDGGAGLVDVRSVAAVYEQEGFTLIELKSGNIMEVSTPFSVIAEAVS